MADTILTSETDTLNPFDALAKRAEAAKGSDRELDMLIYRRVSGVPETAVSDSLGFVTWSEPGHRTGNGTPYTKLMCKETPTYTSSVDAAMTLIPEGWALDGLSMWPGSKSLDACRANLLGTYERNGERWHNSKCGRTKGSGATPANALTAACLRAHASSAP